MGRRRYLRAMVCLRRCWQCSEMSGRHMRCHEGQTSLVVAVLLLLVVVVVVLREDGRGCAHSQLTVRWQWTRRPASVRKRLSRCAGQCCVFVQRL